MSRDCVKCWSRRPKCTKAGRFIRTSDKKIIQRYRCSYCGHVFSDATFQECYRQKKRRINPRVLEFLCSGVSQRRSAKLLSVTRTTIARKLLFLADKFRTLNKRQFENSNLISEMQFDDLETIEHTKCKPLSVTLAVEKSTRKILAFKVSQMPAKGLLAKISRKKYGFRPDHRQKAREEFFQILQPKILPDALIESDQNPHYLEPVKRYFPQANYQTTPGGRGAIAGQGELKKLKFDPLFSLNHTFAMLRANINRLFRKTWCTTKDPRRLQDHIELYMYFHNNILLKQQAA